MTALGQKSIGKAMASAMMLLVLCMSIPFSAFAQVALTVDLKADGQDALTLASSSSSFTVNLTSTGATACQLTSPDPANVSVDMSSAISPGHAWYPAVGGSVTFTVTCTDGVTNVSDSVVVSLSASAPAPVTLAVDIDVNGSDGPVTINNGDTYTYSWTSSSNVTACQLTSPDPANISTSGTSVPVGAGHAWYPTTGVSKTFTITCTDGVSNVSDSVTVSLASGGGGGGGGGAVTADIKINGSDGPVVTIASGTPYTYSWSSSSNVTACQLTSPDPANISTSGTSTPVGPGHAWYPTASSTKTFTLVCTNGTTNATDSVTVALAGASSITADIKINGSDGPVTINNGDTYTYSWTSSSNVTACQLTSPDPANISTNGTSTPIGPGHAWYPAVGGSKTFTLVCTDGVSNATDSAVVNIATPSSGGGGGGGGGGSSSGGSSGSSSGRANVLAPNTGAACLFIRDYMRMDFQNDPMEVMKLQSFLKVFEGHNEVQITGVFDQITFNAVSAFQMKYFSDILEPWGHTGPTGYVYILTLKKINELYCLGIFPLNEAQIQEIIAFKALISGLRAQGVNVDLLPTTGSGTITVPVAETGSTTATSTEVTIPIVGTATTTDSQGQNTAKLAAVLFAAPQGAMDTLQCIYEFLLVLIVLYILGSILEDVLYKKEDPAKARARFYSKWITIVLGLIVAMVIAYMALEWCLILPLLLALILSLVWMSLYPKHSTIANDAKSWYVTTAERTKNAFQKKTTTITTTETKA